MIICATSSRSVIPRSQLFTGCAPGVLELTAGFFTGGVVELAPSQTAKAISESADRVNLTNCFLP